MLHCSSFSARRSRRPYTTAASASSQQVQPQEEAAHLGPAGCCPATVVNARERWSSPAGRTTLRNFRKTRTPTGVFTAPPCGKTLRNFRKISNYWQPASRAIDLGTYRDRSLPASCLPGGDLLTAAARRSAPGAAAAFFEQVFFAKLFIYSFKTGFKNCVFRRFLDRFYSEAVHIFVQNRVQKLCFSSLSGRVL